MRKLLLSATVAIALASCTNSKQIEKYSEIYKYRVYDHVLNQLYFTNEVEFVGGAIKFISQHGEPLVCSSYTFVEHGD